MEFLKKLFAYLRDERGATLNVMAYSAGAGDLDYAIPEHWSERLFNDAMRRAFWGEKFEGKEGSNKPVITKDDFQKQAGDAIHFQVVSQLISQGKTGEDSLAGNEDKLALSQFNLTVDWIRNAVSWTKNVEKRVNFSIQQVVRERLANWCARYIDDSMFTQLITTETAQKTIYSGNASSEANIGTSDTFSTESIDRIKLGLQRLGALPISVKRENGEELESFGVVISEVDEYWLKGDDKWIEAQQYAGIRGEGNRIFTGAIGIWNGCIIYTHRSVRSANNIQGSPLRPECRLYATITDASTNITVGASGKSDFTKFFPSTGTIKIDNEEIVYSGKGIYYFTASSRGANGTTAAAHTEGALITLRDISTQIGFGAEVALRGWGMKPTPISQTYDYGFEIGLGIEAIFGQAAVRDTGSIPKNYLLCKSCGKNPTSTV